MGSAARGTNPPPLPLSSPPSTSPPKETTKGPWPGPGHLPEEPAFVTFLREVTFWGPRPEPDLLPEEHSESATRVSDSVGQHGTSAQ